MVNGVGIGKYNKSPRKEDKYLDKFLVPALSGIYAGLGSVALGETGSLPVMGQLVNGPLGIGGIVFCSSLLCNAVAPEILERIPGNYKWANFEKNAGKPVLTGLAATILVKATVPTATSAGMMKPFVIGFGSEIAAQYTENTVKDLIHSIKK